MVKMGKASSRKRKSRSAKQKKPSKNSKNNLKPGALPQKVAKSCTDLGKKRVAVVNVSNVNDDLEAENDIIDKSPLMLSPVRFEFGPGNGPFDIIRQNSLQKTPKTPRLQEFESGSRLESLPMDLLVKILCHLHHDQLRAVFHVSQKIRKAVIQARQWYFNYTTPDRARQEMLRNITPLPTDCWPFVGKGDGKAMCIPSPSTPKAPRHGPRPPSRVKLSEMRQISAVLFQEPTFPSRYFVPSVLSKPLCKSMVSNRVLFYEDELCQAVAQNKLR